jgi:OOP family OmpA-OmpF porin
VLLAAVASLAPIGPLGAEETPALDLEPAPAGDRGFVVERARVHGDLTPSARAFFSYAKAPLTPRAQADEADPVVGQQAILHALAALPVSHRLVVHLDLPVILSETSGLRPVGQTPNPSPSGGGLGDARLGGRLRLLGSEEDEPDKLDGAVALSLSLPTATTSYGGDGALRARLAALVEATTPRLYGAATLAFATRPETTVSALLPLRTGLTGSLGLAGGFFADSHEELAFGLELALDTTLGGGVGFLDPRASRAHLFATGHARVGGGPLELGLAFGPGFGEGPGAADYRVLALAGFAADIPEPPPDGDADSIPDKADACPRTPGIGSPDPLLHGCPEAPPDRDGDAIPDPQDACPDVAGQATASRRTHGCPPPKDSDADGLFDHEDACPDAAGPRPPAGDGCPPPKRRATLVESRIELTQQVLFETGTAVLRPESDDVLGEIAEVLTAHPELSRVEVQGHTDETGTPELNRVLGQERAQAVVNWLVSRGVAPGRLEAKGYGSDRPLADNTTEEGRQANRRVELHVLETAGGRAP